MNKKDLGFVTSGKMTRNNDFQGNERLMITEFQVWGLLDSLPLMQTSNARNLPYDFGSQWKILESPEFVCKITQTILTKGTWPFPKLPKGYALKK